MSNKKRLMYCLIAGIVLGNIVFWTNRCSHAEVVKVERDTVIVHDTIVDVAPMPKDSMRTRYVTRWLPAKRDTSRNECSENKISVNFSASFPQDSVAVEIPITSKHYGGDSYDAWVSGFEPSLDSIKVYRETQYITERVTIREPPNKVALFLDAGVGYTFNDKRFYPHAGGELVLNNHKRVQFAVVGGVAKTPLDDRVNPYAGGKVKIRLF